MQHKETCVSTIKSGSAFLLCLFIVIGSVMLSRALPIAQYQIFVQLFMILFVGTLIYLLYRFVLTVHVYKLNDQTFTVYRGEGARQKTLANLTPDMIKLIAPSNYTGAQLPTGDFITVNACSSPKGKSKGYSIWCNVGTDDSYRLYIEPSKELIQKLQQTYPDRFAQDNAK